MGNTRTRSSKSILIVWVTMILLTTGVATAVFTSFIIYYRITDELGAADSRLLMAAEMSREIVGADFHDTIDNRTSVSKQRFEQIVKRNDDLCRRLNLQYLWSVLEVDGRLVFTTATHSNINDPRSSCASFFDTHNDPEAFAPAMGSGTQPVYSSFSNEWGQGRMVLVPRKDSRGRLYIFGASLQLEKYNAIYKEAVLAAIVVGVLVMGIAALLALLLTRLVIAPITRLTAAADQMASGDLFCPLPPDGAREIQSLSRSFCRMQKELKHTIDALRDNEERLKRILETMAEGCIFVNATGEIVFANLEAERILGLHHSEIEGKSYVSPDWDILRPDGTLMPPEEMAGPRAMKERQLIRDVVMGIKRNDETVCWTSVCAAPLFGANDTMEGIVGTFTDITDRHHVQEQLQKTQRLESLGVLAGGIAHDFNNLMGGIFGNIDLALDETTQETVAQYLTRAVSSIDRGQSLTQQLLTFSKGGAPSKRVDSLSPFLEQAVQFAISGSNVSCRFHIPDDLRRCVFDRNQIAQVVDNLVVNAKQAMPEGGQIAVSAKNIRVRHGEHPELAEGNYVKISFQDSGPGIPTENITRIFDPFFSTKPGGHGLGLSTGYSIAKRHGGLLNVHSLPGKGSTFHLFLPAAHETSINRGAGNAEAARDHRGNGTILLMDDEETILEMEKEMLSSFGYSVICARDGAEALDYFSDKPVNGHNISALILDLTIPGGLGGKETLNRIRETGIETPAFVSSGYAEDPVMAHPTQHGFTASIHKPFRKAELAEILAKHLPQA